MREINCYIPIKVRITGDLGSVQAEQLEETLTLAVSQRIALATREMKAREGRIQPPQFHRPVIAFPDTLSHDQQADVRALVYRSISRATQKSTTGDEGSPIATRLDIIPASYTPPQHQGRPVSKALQTRGRPWIILKAMNFHAYVGQFLDDFLDYISSLSGQEPIAGTEVYMDLLDQKRWVSAWLVQVNRPLLLKSELVPILYKRAKELSRVQSNQDLFYGYGTLESVRAKLIEIDQDAIVAREMPSLARNARLIEGEGRDARLLPGAWVLFSSMVLPILKLKDFAEAGLELQVTMALRDLSFLITPALFEHRHRFSWESYLQEFGDTPVIVRLQPLALRRRLHVIALEYLVGQMVDERVRRDPGWGSDSVYYGRLYVLNNNTLSRFPSPVRDSANGLTNDVTRGLDEMQIAGDLETNWKAAYISATLTISQASIDAAHYRPRARQNAAALLAKLEGDPGAGGWADDLLKFLRDHHPLYDPVFEYVLEELERQQQFNLLFDKVEASGHSGLHQYLIQLALATRYASHARVRQSFDVLNRFVTGWRNAYKISEQEIWLDQDPNRRLRAAGPKGDVLADFNSTYSDKEKRTRLKPTRLPEFKQAFEEEGKALIGRILRGEDTNQYDQKSFAKAVLGAAVQRIHLTQDDFEKVTVERSVRVCFIKSGIEEALIRYHITINAVERVKGEVEWVDVPGSQRWVREADFEMMLFGWELGKTADVLEAFGIGISVIGLIAFAWEAGVIAVLVEAAGGTTAVLVSITISELIYVIRVVFGNAELSLRGFLEAALDGYLMALGFRGAGFLGRAAAEAIGKETLKSVVGGWVAERLIVGVVGGAGTAALATFSHDLINIATGEGGWSGFGTYVRNMALGAAVGIVIEFVGMPVLKSLGRTALESLTDARELAKLIRTEGIGAVRWTSLITEGLSNVRARLSVIIGDVAAQGFVKAMSERLTEVAEQLGTRFVSQRVLELAQATLTRTAGQGLEKLLTAAELNPSRALSLFNALADNPQQAVAFLELANGLEQSSIRRVLNSFSASNTAQIQEQVRSLLQSGPARESLASFLDLVWANRQQIISEGDSDAVYRLYSRATVPNPLTRSPQEYLDEIAEITQGRPQGAVSNIQGNPIKGFHRFERAGADLSAIQERIYLNVKADQAPEVMRFVVRDIVDNTSQVPGVGMAKLTGPGAISGRADAVVIYAENQAAVQNVLDRIRSYHTAHPEYFQSTTPPMTNQVMDGVSVGAEPLGVGGRASFGSIRSDVIYDALDQAVFANETRQQFRERVLTLFQRRGVNPEAPHLNLPTGGNP